MAGKSIVIPSEARNRDRPDRGLSPRPTTLRFLASLGMTPTASRYHIWLFRLDANDPQAVRVVVDIGESIFHHHAPRVGRVLHLAIHVARVHVYHLALLRPEIAAQLAR